MGKIPGDSGTPGEPTPPQQVSTPGLPQWISNATLDGNVMRLNSLAANPEEARGPRFSSGEDVRRWFVGKPSWFPGVMALRAALRSIPALAGDDELVILSAFRAVSAAWVLTVDPRWARNSSKYRLPGNFGPDPAANTLSAKIPEIASGAIRIASADPRIRRVSRAASAVTYSTIVAAGIADAGSSAADHA
jgi:hypothetical protein